MNRLVLVIATTIALALPALPARSAGFECEFYAGARPVYYGGYGWVCLHDTLTQNCTVCCNAATNTCCVNGNCY